MITKQDLSELFKKEFVTTLKVLRAYPSDKNDFKPHERSSNVIQLSSTFVFEMYLISAYAFNEEIDRSKFSNYRPESVKAIADDFEREANHILSKLDQVTDADLSRTIEFAGAKFVADKFILMNLFDQIHHRGQLTVYVRMAGGKVPAIYGPSADDESTNL